ncbi:MAG: class I SAM-dependent methyltransferase, partial [Dehalococcoidia bacterium]|nr:class I SAM-dependent methyltransferase [Dehalococcoidia bacterium]
PLGLAAIADRLDHGDTLLDIGGGAGRYAVPLARLLRHVTLVEPSPTMAAAARTAFAAAGRDNFTVVEREWPSVRVPKASAVLIANVLSPIEDLEGFLQAALRRASEWLFIIHGNHDEGGPATARVVEAFHGEPRVPNPGLSELLPALYELGIFPDVTMSSRRFTRTFADLDEAARSIAATALVAPTPRALARICRLLRGQLRRARGGRLAAPLQELPVGLLIWKL